MRDNEQWLNERRAGPPQPKASGWNKAAAWAVGTVVLIVLLAWASSCDNHATSAPRGSGGVTNLPVHPTIGGALAGAEAGYVDQAQKRAELPAPTYPPAPPKQQASSGGIEDGTYEVGAEIAPGKYKSDGSDLCYWALLNSSDEGDIRTNHFGAGKTTVTIKPTDKYFQTRGCPGWVSVPS